MNASAATTDPGPAPDSSNAFSLLRDGLAATPELREGMAATVSIALATSLGRVSMPVLIQQTLDRGVLGPSGYRGGFVAAACAAATVLVGVLYALRRHNQIRLVRTAENSLFGLRTRTFEHIHRLSMAEVSESRRAALVARVTSDIETLARFAQSGALAWIVNSAVIVVAAGVMVVYSWRLALVVFLAFLPLVVLLRSLGHRQLQAYDDLRSTVSTKLTEVSEVVTGAAVVRSYGLEPQLGERLRQAADAQYQAQLRAGRILIGSFGLADLSGALAVAALIVVGVTVGSDWGVTSGQLIAFLFLVNLVLVPISELTEVLDQTQTALAGWRKILTVLRSEIDVPEHGCGSALPAGPLGVELVAVDFAYRHGEQVLHGVTIVVPAGAKVALIGQTGSGKSTIARLLCRLADPTGGAVRVGGVDLRDVDATQRQQGILMVPQDGFLFDTTIAGNVALGRLGASRDDVMAAFASLGLDRWLHRLPNGLDTRVGERGGDLSAGERQFVALARAQLATPGLLVLDEATSAVDADIEQSLARALDRLTDGRTVVSIAHRLSTAESADLVIVLDRGRIAESGTHDELLERGGLYAGLQRSWAAATQLGPA